MPQMDPHVHIARKIRSVESVKVHMLQQMTDVFRSIQTGSEPDMAQSLGGLVGMTYYLARQLGLDLRNIDNHAQDAWTNTVASEETDSGDLEFVRQYLQSLR